MPLWPGRYCANVPSVALMFNISCIIKIWSEVSAVFDRYWNSELANPASVLLKEEPLTPEKIQENRDQLTKYVADS